MDNKECEVCTRMVKEKYKHYKTWKILAIVFICLTVLFAILYFADGDLIVKETTENNIEIENGDGINENNIVTGSGSTISGIVNEKPSIGTIIVVCIVVAMGGVLVVCYTVSIKKSDKQHHNKEQEK